MPWWEEFGYNFDDPWWERMGRDVGEAQGAAPQGGEGAPTEPSAPNAPTEPVEKPAHEWAPTTGIPEETPILGGLSRAMRQAMRHPTDWTAGLYDIPILGELPHIPRAVMDVTYEAAAPVAGALIGAGNVLARKETELLGNPIWGTAEEYVAQEQQKLAEQGKGQGGDIYGALRAIGENAPWEQQLAANVVNPVYWATGDFGITRAMAKAAAAAHNVPTGSLSLVQRALLGVKGKEEEAIETLFQRGVMPVAGRIPVVGKRLFTQEATSTAAGILTNVVDNHAVRINQVTEGVADVFHGLSNLAELEGALKSGAASEFLPLTRGALQSKVAQQMRHLLGNFEPNQVFRQAASAAHLLSMPEDLMAATDFLATGGKGVGIAEAALSPATRQAVQLLGKGGTAIYDPLVSAGRKMIEIDAAVKAGAMAQAAAEAAIKAIQEEAGQNILTATKAVLQSKFIEHTGQALAGMYGVKYQPAQVGVVRGLPGVVKGATFVKANPNALDNLLYSVKSLQSAVVLGLNPLYVVRNFWNNYATMVSRGVLGYWTKERQLALLKELGVNPMRFAQGFGVGGIGGAARFGLQELAAKTEAAASANAYATGAAKALRQLMRRGKGWDLAPSTAEALRGVDPSGALEHQVVQMIERYGTNRLEAMARLRQILADPATAPAYIDFDRVVQHLRTQPGYDWVTPEDLVDRFQQILPFYREVRTPEDLARARQQAEGWLQEQLKETALRQALERERLDPRYRGMGPRDLRTEIEATEPYTAGARGYTRRELDKLLEEASTQFMTPQELEAYNRAHPDFYAEPRETPRGWLRSKAEEPPADWWQEPRPAPPVTPLKPELEKRVRAAGGRAIYEVLGGPLAARRAWEKYISDVPLPGTLVAAREFAVSHPTEFARWETYLAQNKLWQELKTGTARAEWLKQNRGVEIAAERLTARRVPEKVKEAWYGFGPREKGAAAPVPPQPPAAAPVPPQPPVAPAGVTAPPSAPTAARESPRGLGGVWQSGIASEIPEDYMRAARVPANIGLQVDQYAARNLRALMDAVEQTADFARPVTQRVMPPQLLTDLEQNIFPMIGDVKIAAAKMGEFYRDAALLNYQNRYGFNAALALIFPYEFWMTRSMLQWAEYFLDRPGMLALYAKMRDILYNKMYEEDYPERLRGMVKVSLPFIPDWLGSSVGFVNPLNALLPIEQMMAPVTQARYLLAGEHDVAVRVRQMIANGEVSQVEGEQAIKTGKGPVWEMAKESVQQLDANPFDIAGLVASPYVPLDWMWKIATGRPEDIRGMLPVAPLVQGATAVARTLGLKGIPPGGINIDPVAYLKEKLFNAPYDPWENYRIDRALAGLVARGELKPDEAFLAMIERKGPAYERAVEFAALEQAVPSLTALTGFRVKTAAPGEVQIRREQETLRLRVDDLVKAAGRDPAKMTYDEKKALLKRTGAWKEVSQYYETHPELTTNIEKNREVEERLRDWYQDVLWKQYNALSELDKRLWRQQNPDAAEKFVVKPSRVDINTLPLTMLARWVYSLRGYIPRVPPGPGMPQNEDFRAMGLQPYQKVAPELSAAYKEWLSHYTAVKDLEAAYYGLAQGSQERRDYLAQHPELKAYFEWNDQFWAEHPALAKLLGRETQAGTAAPARGGGGYRPAASYTPRANEWQQLQRDLANRPNLLSLITSYLMRSPADADKWAQDYPELLAWLRTVSAATLARLRYQFNASKVRVAGPSTRIHSLPWRVPYTTKRRL